MNDIIKNFLDGEGRVKCWSSKRQKKISVIEYMASKFEVGRDYTENEVNEVISKWHTFGDYFILRRSMIEYQLLSRTPDGARYWKDKSDVVV
jgi:hypothetical protein